MYIRERRICGNCQAYYDEKRLEKGFKTFLYRPSYLKYRCKNCGWHELMLEIEVVSERTPKPEL